MPEYTGSLIGHVDVAVPDLDRAAVDAFYAAALAAGATSEVAPALHPEYQPDYHGAFVPDPEGVSLEVVRHTPVA